MPDVRGTRAPPSHVTSLHETNLKAVQHVPYGHFIHNSTKSFTEKRAVLSTKLNEGKKSSHARHFLYKLWRFLDVPK